MQENLFAKWQKIEYLQQQIYKLTMIKLNQLEHDPTQVIDAVARDITALQESLNNLLLVRQQTYFKPQFFPLFSDNIMRLNIVSNNDFSPKL